LAIRDFKLSKSVCVEIKVSLEVTVVERAGLVPTTVWIALTSSWRRFGCDASIRSTTLDLLTKVLIWDGYVATAILSMLSTKVG
jgi:hypothetical protein